jgi:hypothetical protein
VGAAIATISLRAQSSANLILTNGKIVTVDERFAIAQAIAVRGDRIIAVGSNADISRLADTSTRRIDLHGRTVVPVSSTTTCTCCARPRHGRASSGGTAFTRANRRSTC